MLKLYNFKIDLVVNCGIKKRIGNTINGPLDVRIKFKVKNDWNACDFNKEIERIDKRLEVILKTYVESNGGEKNIIILEHCDVLKTANFSFNYQINLTYIPKETNKNKIKKSLNELVKDLTNIIDI